MDVGFLFDLRNPARWRRPWVDHYARALELCEEIDQRGAGGIWFTEHHQFADGYLPQPLTFAAAAAARTRTVRIGTAVVLPALRKPAQLAEEAAIVDLISGGRLELGMGAGYRVPEYRLFDADITRRFRTVEHTVHEIRRLWTEGGVTPAPVQDPLPMWGGFYGPRGARLSGRLGLGLLHISHEMIGYYHAGLAEGGHDPATARMAGLLPVMLAEDPEAAWPRVVDHLAHQMNTYRQGAVDGTGIPRLPLLGPEELRNPAYLEILTPEDAATAILDAIGDLPVAHLIFWSSIAAMPDDLVQANIDLICRRLLPLLSRGTPSDRAT